MADSQEKLRVGYVPEHFSLPLLQLASSAWGKEHIELVSQPSGTGQMLTSLAARPRPDIDIAIALTEALIAGIAKGRSDYELVGSYVKSSLNWAVITGTDAKADKYKSIDDLRSTTLGISRLGSGSQVMASVMALQQGWSTDDVKFKVNDNFENLRNGVNQQSGLETSAFMWEWFTTKPFVNSGEVRFIGSVPTPWPSWTIAASKSFTEQTPTPSTETKLHKFLGKLADQVKKFTSDEEKAKSTIVEQMKYDAKDVDQWYAGVRWVGDSREGQGSGGKRLKGQSVKTNEVSEEVLLQTLETLQKAGVVEEPQGGWDLDRFVTSDRRVA
ncbi:hypothetical protein FA10DRAFT_265958 [Acaromyces ingoldii]|uniref:Ca3427-like PBP 2 domain-containing protein n=1 Tax=Acaromyces ingoldii TaxID=215250 RepID=A0A316YRY4_9BASI|nr:hypothetical protein FA10DRAFT_265958 [Acaromyces ingoldii]PWN92157.1 hypothetical protein FA10DRAFT_265958 [Acaromyces ingoldii]